MIKIDRNSTYIELKEFLEDVFVFLSNQYRPVNSNSEISENVDTNQHLQLLPRCKNLLNFFEDLTIDDQSSTNYLDMSGNLKNDSPIEYMNYEKEFSLLSGNDYNNINCTANDYHCDEQNDDESEMLTELLDIRGKMLSKSDTTTLDAAVIQNLRTSSCPFSGLPAVHLSIKHALHFGFVYRIEKRIIFDQTRKYYAGILGVWLLLYGTNTDLKPLHVIELTKHNLEINHGNETKKQRDYSFSIVNRENPDERFQFYVTDSKDYQKWIETICVAEIETDGLLNETTCRNRANTYSRKLPTPPPSPVISQPRSSNRSDDIYEEPENLLYENQSSLNDNQRQGVEQSEIVTTDNSVELLPVGIEYDVPKTPPVPVINFPPPNVSLKINVTSQANDPDNYQDRIRHVKTILSSQLGNSPSSPNKNKLKFNFDPDTIQDNLQSQSQSVSTSSPSKTPIKSWLKNHLSRSSSKKIKHIENQHIIIKPKISDDPKCGVSVNSTNLTSRLTVKGEKVNEIINQLEANGQLAIFAKGLPHRRTILLSSE